MNLSTISTSPEEAREIANRLFNRYKKFDKITDQECGQILEESYKSFNN
jgi:hypothetical protein